MSEFVTRPVEARDHDWIVALNQVHVQATAPMDHVGLHALLDQCPYTCIVEDQAGFVLCMDHTSTDDGPNISWFKARFER